MKKQFLTNISNSEFRIFLENAPLYFSVTYTLHSLHSYNCNTSQKLLLVLITEYLVILSTPVIHSALRKNRKLSNPTDDEPVAPEKKRAAREKNAVSDALATALLAAFLYLCIM